MIRSTYLVVSLIVSVTGFAQAQSSFVDTLRMGEVPISECDQIWQTLIAEEFTLSSWLTAVENGDCAEGSLCQYEQYSGFIHLSWARLILDLSVCSSFTGYFEMDHYDTCGQGCTRVLVYAPGGYAGGEEPVFQYESSYSDTWSRIQGTIVEHGTVVIIGCSVNIPEIRLFTFASPVESLSLSAVKALY